MSRRWRCGGKKPLGATAASYSHLINDTQADSYSNIGVKSGNVPPPGLGETKISCIGNVSAIWYHDQLDTRIDRRQSLNDRSRTVLSAAIDQHQHFPFCVGLPLNTPNGLFNKGHSPQFFFTTTS